MNCPLSPGSFPQTAGPLADTSHKNTGAAQEPETRPAVPDLQTLKPALWILSPSGKEEAGSSQGFFRTPPTLHLRCFPRNVSIHH